MSRIAACYAQLGRLEEARAAAAQVLRMKPDFSIMRLRRSGWNTEDVEHIRSGMRKAGLPD
jgi:adenylate cyclase